MENLIYKVLGTNANSNTLNNNKVTVGYTDPNSELYKEVMRRQRERKEAGYDPNPITVDVYNSGNPSQRACWTFDRFEIFPHLWVEGETGSKDWTRHRTPHDTITFMNSDGEVEARIFYGLKENRLLTEIYKDTAGIYLKALGITGITDSKEYFRGGESHDVFLDTEGNLWVANEALKEPDSKESVDAIQSILTLLWDRSQPFQWLAFEGYILFGDNTQVICVDRHGSSRYFRWNQDLAKWRHYTTDLNRFLSVEFPETLPEVLDPDDPDVVFDISSRCRRTTVTLFNAFKAAKKRKKSTLSSREANTLMAEIVADPYSVFTRVVEDDSSKAHETFAWGCDMGGKILVDEDAKRRVKPEWSDKVVICHEHFRREAPSCWSFPEGNIDILDVLEDEAEVKSNTVYTGAGCTFVSLGGKVVALNNPCNSRTTKEIDDGKGSQTSIYWEVNKLPLIDWERTLAARPHTTVGDLKAGRFYCWEGGSSQRENDHQTGRRTSAWMVSLATK